MQTDNWRHTSEILAELGLYDAGMKRAGAACEGARRRVTDAQGETASGLPGARGGVRGPKLRLVTIDGVRVA